MNTFISCSCFIIVIAVVIGVLFQYTHLFVKTEQNPYLKPFSNAIITFMTKCSSNTKNAFMNLSVLDSTAGSPVVAQKIGTSETESGYGHNDLWNWIPMDSKKTSGFLLNSSANLPLKVNSDKTIVLGNSPSDGTPLSIMLNIDNSVSLSFNDGSLSVLGIPSNACSNSPFQSTSALVENYIVSFFFTI